MVIVAVGPAEVLEPQFAGIGPVTVWSPEGEPRPLSDPSSAPG